MKLCISYWSVKDGGGGNRPIEEAIVEAKEAGYDGIELAAGPTGYFSIESDQKTVEGYRAPGQKHGLLLETVAAGLSWGCSPTDPKKEVRERSIAMHTAALQRAAWLGAKSMLMVPGAVKIPWNAEYAPVPYDDAVKWAKEAANRLAEVAERVNVELCLENVWNGMFYSPLEFVDFVDSTGSKMVGAYFDVGNVLGYHQDPADWIRLLGKRIRRVHIKDFKTAVGNLSGFCDLLAGDVPWVNVMGALRGIGYDKTLVAEMMPPEEGFNERTREAMGKIVKM